MKEYEILLNDLLTQQAQLEIERGWNVNKRDLLNFIAELLQGNPHDKEHQRIIIDNLVYRVYVYDGYKVVYLNLSGGKGIEGERITLKDTDNAVKGVLDVRTQFPPPRHSRSYTNFYNYISAYVVAKNGVVGLLVDRVPQPKAKKQRRRKKPSKATVD